MKEVGLETFKELLRFEYKKMLCKKSIGIFFGLGIILTALRYIWFAGVTEKTLSGVNYFLEMSDTTILIIFLLITICIAPLFAQEYTTRVDKLILASKNGKNKLIAAKIIVGSSVAIGIFVAFFLVAYLGTVVACGFETSSQEEWRGLWIYCSCALSGTLFSAVIGMLFSAKLKSPYSALVISFLFMIGCRMLYLPEAGKVVKAITQLLPIQMANLATVFSGFTYSIGGSQLETYKCIPLVAIGLSVSIILWVYRIVKNHQSY